MSPQKETYLKRMSYQTRQPEKPKRLLLNRVVVLRSLLIVVGVVLIGRLFYVQIIRHDYYKAQALQEHVKKFAIPPKRGTISFQDSNGGAVPVVLNESRYLVYADPQYVKDPAATADKLVGILGGDKKQLEEKLQTPNTRYVILAKLVPKDRSARIEKLDLHGIGQKEISVRTYPQGVIASQVLGFVNDDGQGQYGIEGYLNAQLTGTAGQQKAVTDVRGIPLANNDNVLKAAKDGANLVLTLDVAMQRIVEEKLKASVDRTQSLRGNAVVLDVRTGAVKAMANYPTYDPSQYRDVAGQEVFVNGTVSYAWEPGSVIKPLVVATAINEGKASPNTTYFDAGYTKIDDRTVTNAINFGAQTMSVTDVLSKSLNTGAVQVLRFIGGGQITNAARETYYKYLTGHYQFGKLTGIEQDGEETGYISSPNEGDGLNVRYANMSFGQGMTVTPLQLAAAYTALVNGGTYYKPYLVASENGQPTTPTVVMQGVVSESTSSELRGMLKTTLEINNKPAMRSGYALGAKSGTAQVSNGSGSYKSDAYNGAYIGYIGGDSPEYVMVVRLDEPKTAGFASAQASKTWAEISNGILDTIPVRPKSP